MKNDLPYFSHNNNARRHPKMKALIAEYGFEGYGRFWALCERIAEDSDAYLDISKKANRLDLAGELGLDGNGLDSFLAFLADPEIDLINFADGVVTIDRITVLFEQTSKGREDARQRNAGKKGKSKSSGEQRESSEGKEKSSGEPDKKEEKKREEKTRQENSCGSGESPSPGSFSEKPSEPAENPDPPETADPSPAETSAGSGRALAPKAKKPPLREREPENALEIVEKAYRRNWDRLCAEGRVRTRDPVVNWAQARKLLSTHFAKGIAPEKIVEAINNGLKNDFVMRGGYSPTMMLSATVLNGLLNSTGPPKGSPHRIASDEIPGDEWERYFARDDLDGSLGEG